MPSSASSISAPAMRYPSWVAKCAPAKSHTASLVALDIKTGALRWHYQTTHHDIFEHDLGTPPLLYDAVIDGQKHRAIGVMRTDGYLFLFDRATGKPILPIEERRGPTKCAAENCPT